MNPEPNKPIILVVDDDASVLDALVLIFSDSYEVRTAPSGAKAIEIAKTEGALATVVMDIKMAEMDGLTAARHIRAVRPQTPIIFHTGFPGEYDEREIDKSEAPYDYVQKGRSVDRLQRSVRNATESYRLKTDAQFLTRGAESEFGMIGRSAAMQEVFRTIRKVAPSDTKVMILGETGTGKELVANAIHSHSQRREKRLGILNCNHKDPGLVESELFGHTRGAFTGAVQDRLGLFEYAHGGSVFLDEIGDLDITTQAKLLRVLETGEYQKIGAPEIGTTDIRLLCATHRSLQEMAESDKFRQDLFYRLRGVEIVLPPLRERKEDIPALIESFASRFTIGKGLPPKVFDAAARERLMEYNWPGNVRQLLEAVKSLIVVTDSEIIFEEDIVQYIDSPQNANFDRTNGLTARMRDQEKTWILEALLRANRNVTTAAKILEIDRSTLHKKINSHGINITLLSDDGP